MVKRRCIRMFNSIVASECLERDRGPGGPPVRCGELKKGPEVLGSSPGSAEEKKKRGC